MTADLDDDGAGVAVLFQRGEVGDVVSATFAGEGKLEFGFVADAVFDVDELGLWQEQLHALFHVDASELEVAEIIGHAEAGLVDFLQQPEQALGRVHGAADVGLDGDGGLRLGGGVGP